MKKKKKPNVNLFGGMAPLSMIRHGWQCGYVGMGGFAARREKQTCNRHIKWPPSQYNKLKEGFLVHRLIIKLGFRR